VEGVWDKPFDDWSFSNTIAFMGSGALARDDVVTFSTPTHSLERIFSVRIGDELWISNSLSFCLAASSTEMDPSFAHYQAEYDSASRGIHKYTNKLPLKNGHTVYCHVFCNISVDKNLALRVHKKPQPPRFSEYLAYTHFLICALTRLMNNAQDKHRTRQYRALATASRGYDSAAVAALAFDAGCRTLFTFSNGRPEYQVAGAYKFNRVNVDDSGEEIARTIGYEQVVVADRWVYLDVTTDIYEAEGCASGNLYYDPTVVHESDLQGSMLLTGHFGDVVWGRLDTGCDLEKGGLSGASLYESRLRIGFVHAPIPYIAGTSLSSIVGIANSDDMRPWQLDNDYDRPIPRRILEERGVHRQSFGVKNRAVGVTLEGDEDNILSKMSAATAQSFSSFLAKARKQRGFVRQLNYDIRHALFMTPFVLPRVARKCGLDLHFTKLRLWLYQSCPKYYRSPRAGSYLFPWGVGRVTRRYTVAQNDLNPKTGQLNEE
jgi:hypothetical protein